PPPPAAPAILSSITVNPESWFCRFQKASFSCMLGLLPHNTKSCHTGMLIAAHPSLLLTCYF
ncbi:MAG TPA: hypothetical protein PKC69_04930, partial [Chitinophagaceae bacterium]|nr:hypothetical protein [Chitinophagaceae bacterium]